MAINILSLNSTVLNLLDKEDVISQEKIELLDSLLKENLHYLDSGVYKELESMKTMLIHKRKTTHAVFLARTHSLIEEYT